MSRFDFVPATASDAGFSAADLAELDAYYETMIAKGELPGHVLLLARGDKMVRGHVAGFADWESKAPRDAPQGRVEVFFRPDEVTFAPADGAGLAAEVKAVAARGPDVRIECLIEGRPMELEAHGQAAPAGVAPGLSVRVKPLRPRVYAAG